MAHEVKFHVLAEEDLASLPRNIQSRILRAIKKRLETEPLHYGIRLRRSLSSLWKLRVGDYRVVYEVHAQTVTVWAIQHRKNVYPEAERRRLGR